MTKNITDILRPFLVVLFIFGFGSLIGCGGGGGGNTAMTTPQPVPLALESPNVGALHYSGFGARHWLIVVSVAAEGEDLMLYNQGIPLRTLSVSRFRHESVDRSFHLPVFNTVSLHATGDLVPLVEGGVTVTSGVSNISVAFETRPSIIMLAQLCSVNWLADYINGNGILPDCPSASQLSYSPDMRRVVHAAMADTFHRGIGIGESNFAFSGRHNGDDRAAGFTYDMGSFAMRTDYIRLPSKQDSAVFLDTYRFGILQSINDESRFFAGVDSYRNAIFALDVNAENLHRFGIALGEGYAVKYELRIRL